MGQKNIYCPRENSGSSAGDGALWFNANDTSALGSQYIVNSVVVSFTRLCSASGSFTGQTDFGIVLTNDEYLYIGTIYDVRFSANGSYTTTISNRTFSVDNTIGNKLASIGIKRLELSRATQNDGITEKDIKCSSSSVGDLYLNYSDKPTPPTTPTLNINITQAAPNGQATLSWSSSSPGTGASSVSYDIYRNSSILASGINGNSYNVTASATAGQTYSFYIIAKNNLNLYSSASNTVNLTAVRGSNGAPSNLLVAGTKIAYIGSNNLPNSLNLTWSQGTTGTNNSITGYAILLNGVQKATVGNNVTSCNIISYGVGTYTVQTLGGDGSKVTSSESVNVNRISNPSSVSITTSLPLKTASNVSLSWNAIGTYTGVTKIEYDIRYFTQNTEKTLSVIRNTSYTFDINNVIQGDSFRIRIYTIATASQGGYSISQLYESPEITRAVPFSFPSPFWTSMYDTTTSLQNVLTDYGYENVYLSWNKIDNVNPYTYELSYKIGDNGNWSVLNTGSNLLNFTLSLGSITNGSKVVFSVKVTDQYGVSQSQERAFYKMTTPSLYNLTVSNITDKTLQTNFRWGFTNNSNDNLIYKIYLLYNGIPQEYATGEFTTGTTPKIQNNLLEIGLHQESDTGTFIGALYNKVILNKDCRPTGQARVELYSKSIPSCKTVQTVDFIFNFFKEITSLDKPTVSVPLGSYFNPNDSIVFRFTAADWEDATGQQIGADISYRLEGNGKVFQNILPDTDISDVAPNTNQDSTIRYTLYATLTYANDITSIKTSFIEINVARWSSSGSNALLQDVHKTESTIRGTLIFPQDLCGSIKYSNQKQVKYKIFKIIENDQQQIGNEVTLTLSEIQEKNYRIDFTFDETSNQSFSFFIEVTYINTSDEEIIKNTTSYLLRISGIPLAIRKGRIGINVDNDFRVQENEEDSALYIAAKNGADSAPVLEISANAAESAYTLAKFSKGINEVGKLYVIKNKKIGFEGLSESTNITLMSNNWSSDSGNAPFKYRIENELITENSLQEIIPDYSTLTIEQLQQLQSANIVGGEQEEGACYIYAYGEKPSNDIAITLIIKFI